MRLSRGKDFLAVRRGGVRISAGPLTFSIRPNELEHPRLGLSISRFVGKAAVRNTIKRRLREAFRLGQYALPALPSVPASKPRDAQAKAQAAGAGGYDVVIGARTHGPLALAEYQRLLGQAMREAHERWQRKRQRTSTRKSQAEHAPGSDAEGAA
jgi:ribonuclease P protein component